ncbi:6-phosphogluconate dehydrogenase C-terminal domain-like protein [Whalleya microplaca]|nr:6-phosphogluconate dehydrogenase C-terminal domain-like protein [Whalleya microplaca]
MASLSAKIGVLSIGDMGMGIAKLLVANGFSVATNCKGRSNDTIERAKSAQVELLKSDEDLTQACAVVLSVVPPRDAVATAQRVIDALTGPLRRSESDPLYFADLNALAPSSTKAIAALFATSRAAVRFVDGSIIGGPPVPKADGTWDVPSIPTSGPHSLAEIPGFGAKLAATLNTRHISADVGAASGLKMCFASMSKGFTALAIQSFTTAHRLGVLGELRDEMQTLMPDAWRKAERGVVGMAPKAYRWVREMEEIALTFEEEGGFPQDSFQGAAKVYRTVAEDTSLGLEKIGKRKRGTNAEDMAAAMAEGMDTKRKKND